ncbi:UNVERIFIED_CONTAM: hypothetical protein FKN15_005650 [Acipenser sinensis]
MESLFKSTLSSTVVSYQRAVPLNACVVEVTLQPVTLTHGRQGGRTEAYGILLYYSTTKMPLEVISTHSAWLLHEGQSLFFHSVENPVPTTDVKVII